MKMLWLAFAAASVLIGCSDKSYDYTGDYRITYGDNCSRELKEGDVPPYLMRERVLNAIMWRLVPDEVDDNGVPITYTLMTPPSYNYRSDDLIEYGSFTVRSDGSAELLWQNSPIDENDEETDYEYTERLVIEPKDDEHILWVSATKRVLMPKYDDSIDYNNTELVNGDWSSLPSVEVEYEFVETDYFNDADAIDKGDYERWPYYFKGKSGICLQKVPRSETVR